MVRQIGILAVTVDVQFLGDALASRKFRDFDRLVHRVLGHQTVRGPLAARDRNQTVVRYDDLVAARNLLRVLALLLGRRQRTLTREYREDVLVGGRRVHVESRRAEDEVDLLLERARVFLCLGTHDVRGADDDFVVPRHGEQHAAVRGLGNHDCVVALQELHVEYDMHALTRRHHSAVRRAVHVHDVVHEAAGGVYDAARLERVLLAGEVVHELHACGAARRVMHDARDGSLIDDRAAVFDAGLRKVHGHTRVVELSVVVHHAAFQSLLDRSRDVFHYLFRRNVFRTSVAETERKHVVEGQTAKIEEIIPVTVIRDHECLVFDQVRGVGFHAAAFAQGFEHQHDVALLQVTYAAVHELRTAARCAFGEVGLFEQRYAQPAGRCVDRHAEARGAPAYHYDIPNLVFLG